MRITGGSALSKDDIERMVKEAEAHADEDRQRREDAEVRNGAEQLVYSTEKFLRDSEDKLPADGKEETETAISELKKALEGDDIGEIKAKQENLATVSQKLGTALYEQAAANQASEGAAASEGATDEATTSSDADDDVVDAEIVDEDK